MDNLCCRCLLIQKKKNKLINLSIKGCLCFVPCKQIQVNHVDAPGEKQGMHDPARVRVQPKINGLCLLYCPHTGYICSVTIINNAFSIWTRWRTSLFCPRCPAYPCAHGRTAQALGNSQHRCFLTQHSFSLYCSLPLRDTTSCERWLINFVIIPKQYQNLRY